MCISFHQQTLRTSFAIPDKIYLLLCVPRGPTSRYMPIPPWHSVEEEILRGNVSSDYGLSKFQEAHRGGGTETYSSIMKNIDKTRKDIGQGVQSWD